MNHTRRFIVVAMLLALGTIGLLGYRLALQQLKAGIESALGPRASVGDISIGWSGVQITDLRVRAARGAWPVDDELRAARVRVLPAWSSLWSTGWRVRRVDIEEAYVSILRTADGRLRVVPALLDKPAAPTSAASAPKGAATSHAPRVHIGEVTLETASLDFFDASVRQPAHRMRFQELEAEIGPLDLPALDTPAKVELQARFKGPQRDGRLHLAGTLTPSSREAALKAQVQGVDLLALQPYLLKVNEGGVKRGTLDLSLDARVKGQQLHAPGKLVLTGLELAPSNGLFGTFAGVPRQAVLAAMERDGRIEVGFTLEGRLDDPAFSLNANLATRLASGLAESLGVSIGGVVEGVGNVIRGLLGR